LIIVIREWKVTRIFLIFHKNKQEALDSEE